MLPPKIDCDIKEHVNRVITVWVRVRLAKQGLLAEGSIRFSFSAVDGTFCINYKALMAPEQALGRGEPSKQRSQLSGQDFNEQGSVGFIGTRRHRKLVA